MYVSGGYKGPYRGHLDNLWSYNSKVDAWVELKPMSHARSYHSMAPSSHDKIIVVGGVNYLTETDTFEDVRVNIYSHNLKNATLAFMLFVEIGWKNLIDHYESVDSIKYNNSWPSCIFSSFRTVKCTAFQQIAGVQLHEHRNVPVVLLRYYLTV